MNILIMTQKLFFSTILAMLCVGIMAQEHTDHVQGSDNKEHHVKHHRCHSHKFQKHHFALFNGVTSNFDHQSTGYSIGLDYEDRINK